MMDRKYRLVGPIALVLACSPTSLFGQSPISLQPLQPLSQGQPELFSPLSPPPSLNTNKPITLESIPKVETSTPLPSTEDSKTVKVLPLVPATQNSGAAKKGSLNVDDMIRRPIQSVEVFSRVNTEPSSGVGAPLAPHVRNQSFDATGYYDWSPNGFCWQSPAFCYSPLYFEQPNLERYGNSKGPFFAPAWSATYFFGQVVALPIAAVRQPPCSKSCTLGNHRPGDCAPFQKRAYHHPLLNKANGPSYTGSSYAEGSVQSSSSTVVGSGSIANTETNLPGQNQEYNAIQAASGVLPSSASTTPEIRRVSAE
jgi:hypothetical protein